MALRLSTGARNRMLGINTNIAVNGTLVTNFTGWTQSTGTAQRNSGTGANSTTGYMECIYNSALGKAISSAAITVTPYTWYKLSYYFQKPASNGDAGLCEIGTSSGGAQVATFKETDATNAWVFREYQFRTGAAVTSIYLSFSQATAAGSDAANFDEITLSEGGGTFQDVYYKGFLEIWSGSQPATPDSQPAGTLLCTMYSNGTSAGLTFADATGGVISKTSTETWSGTAVASGTAGCFRLKTAGDAGGTSTVDERLDGSIATSGADVNMGSTTITSGAVTTLSTFTITAPNAS
jgi:hypothetical protein